MTNFKESRLEEILKIINQEQEVLVSSLVDILQVSPVTIRSDLRQLERDGFVTRTHGGAIAKKDQPRVEGSEVNISGPVLKYDRKKDIVGRVASNYISDTDWVFIGSGTTAYYIAHALVNRSSVNVMTNNLLVAYELRKNPFSNIIMTGGTLSHSTLNLGGEIFEASIQPVTISKAFIALAGISFNNGFTISTSGELNVFKRIRQISKEIYILADSSKFDKDAFIRVGDLCDTDYIVTDVLPPQKYIDYYEEKNIPILTLDDIS